LVVVGFGDGAANAPPRSPGLDAVWVSENGSQLSSASLYRTIIERTDEAFGFQRAAALLSALCRNLDRRGCGRFARSRPRWA
jgi:hypothetical protein